nr:RNA-directed DNA polymerase, eukaryota [Tanacetum cinerariifolium]
MFFKVDFAKAYYSVRWDYLLDVLHAFRFGSKWCRWIRDKSQLLGVGVPRSTVAQAAGEIRCMVLNHQFRYLGVMVGELMSRRSAWDDTVNKIQSCLSNWKTPKGVLKAMEAIRSKFFNGADTSEKKIMWIAWQKALASKIHGGLGISRFYALNRALILKWSVFLLSSDDSWICDLSGDGEYRVKEVCNFIDDLFLPSHPKVTRWVKCIPKKINIFVWRARRDCLPTRQNLIRRGVVLESDVCSLYEDSVEEPRHVFFQCSIAKCVIYRICRWWDLDGQNLTSFSDWQT